VLTGLLREKMGFKGLIITGRDGHAGGGSIGSDEQHPAAIQAGADLILFGHLGDQMKLNDLTRDLLRRKRLARIAAAQAKLPRDRCR